MRPETAKFLWDIVVAAQRVEPFLQGKTESDYGADDLLRSAVERQLYIAGEAVTQAVKLDPLLESSITDSQRIKRFRNLLAHAYFAVKHEVVWQIATVDLPRLTAETEQLLQPSGHGEP